MNDLKVLQYLFDLFFKIFAMRELYTLSMSICWCLIEAEEDPDKPMIKRLEFVKDNTHEKLMIPLSTTELIILTNIGQRNFSKSVEFKDNKGKTRELPLYVIIKYAKESYFELARFVVKIAKKYSLDIPVRPAAGGMMELPDLMGTESPAP